MCKQIDFYVDKSEVNNGDGISTRTSVSSMRPRVTVWPELMLTVVK